MIVGRTRELPSSIDGTLELTASGSDTITEEGTSSFLRRRAARGSGTVTGADPETSPRSDGDEQSSFGGSQEGLPLKDSAALGLRQSLLAVQ